MLGLASGLALPGPARAVEEDTSSDVVRILMVGDSVTQGSSGDWTWRYRLWQHLQTSGVAVDFVGPRSDLRDLRTGGPGATSYVDPDFDRDHAARWGMWSGYPDTPIGTLVADHQPDVVITMLGVNDILYGRSPQSTAEDTTGLVAAARAVDPDLAFVVAEATQHWFTGVSEFNAALGPVTAAVTTAESPVVVAEAAAGYDELQDTWDHAHANARGEVKIAAAVADALAALGIGDPAHRPLVLPPVGPRAGPSLVSTAGDGSATLTWQGAPGATSHLLWARDATAGGQWMLLAEGLPTDGVRTLSPLDNGRRYQYRLQPVKGDDPPEGDVFSAVVDVIPTAPVLPPPPPAPALTAPGWMRAAAGRRCTRLAWRPVSGATSYWIQRRVDGHWTRGVRTTGSRVTLVRLPLQRSWRFRIRAVRGAVAGPQATITVRRRATGRC
ncbi:hypothetical protein ASD81_00670 [Nocardioides sp. Root614]|nr:hypothetical protein ASD81_00670 [Nocardioides sp. Root614]KRA91250.1 hypothetical protein ASD84_00935 [Nocardioides sp. Root682]